MHSSTPTKVWLLIDSLTYGGIDAYVLELAKGLKQHKVSVEVLIVRRYSAISPLISRLEDNKIKFSYLSSSNGFPLRTLLKRVNHRCGDVIHAHGYKASILAKCARIFTGITQVSTYHAGETPQGRVKIYDFLDRYTAFISSSALVVSEKVGNKIPTSTRKLNNFIDNGQLSLSTGEQIAFVGRLSYEKAPERFLQCAKSNPTLNFHIYGSGPLENEIIEKAPANITYHGYQTNMAEVWNHIQILIICSRYEGLPMAALEAMARGCIIIAYNVGDLSKLIDDGKNGFIVDSLDSLNQTLAHISQLNNHDKAVIKNNAIATIQKDFSTSSVIPKLLDIYSGIDAQSDSQFDKNLS